MMRLRREIERGARHPIVGPLVIVLLAVLIAFTVMHEGNEATGGQIGELCVGIALVLLTIIAFRPPAVRAHVALSLAPSRAPPWYQKTAALHSGLVVPGFLPLRL